MYSEPHKSWPPFSEAEGFLRCQVGNALRPPPLACPENMAAIISRRARGGGWRALPTWQRRNPQASLKGGHDLRGSLYIVGDINGAGNLKNDWLIRREPSYFFRLFFPVYNCIRLHGILALEYLKKLFRSQVGQQEDGQCNDAPSYCGILGGKYPDRRPMGFPFDRVPRDRVDSIQSFLTPNMFVMDAKIKFDNRIEPPTNTNFSRSK